jgi:phthalate 4,5-dioxygenase
VLFRDDQGRWGLLDRDCPHRGADLAFARHEGDGIRCPFHGWKFDADGPLPGDPCRARGSTLCQRVRQRATRSSNAAAFCLRGWARARRRHRAFPRLRLLQAHRPAHLRLQGLWHCNWLQAFEVGIDPAHASFLHRFLNDAPLDDIGAYGRKQFRAPAWARSTASAGR